MKLIADLHIHSKYSRATSPDMDIPNIAKWSKYKGIGLIGIGDFTHPLWLGELKRYLKPAGFGVYEYDGVKFFLTTEVCNIYYKSNRTRKIHNMIFAPSFEVVERINQKLARYGNLLADGRPILNLDSEDLVKLILDISDDCLIIPAHVWTPHFSLFGSNSGFDSLVECFSKETGNIYSIETGLSSDPAMNWRLSNLDSITLISNSDAHSLRNLGREANVFEVTSFADLYNEITQIIKTKNRKKFLYTIEFFPEEGKYHFDGHRSCQVRLHPRESISNNDLCPECSRPVTIGVLHRVEELADREEGFIPSDSIPYRNIIPLEEIIAEALGMGKGTATVEREYFNLINKFGSEFNVLLEVQEEKLQSFCQTKISEGIIKMRLRDVEINPGYDGVYGTIKIKWSQEELLEKKQEQLTLF
ncbi:MAG: endonuclease Q family protein [Elusimicrobiota bacterium]|nr:endonuclease Q family protein [Elusimicrobiota bacterium]